MGGDIVFILVVLFSIIRGLYLFFRWAVRGLTRLSAPGQTFAPQAMPPRQPQIPAAPQFQPAARRTDAGLPAVSREATTASFRMEEEQLVRFEADNAFALPQTDASSASRSANPLFATTNDFLRAFILQEALGPPLSRRKQR